MAPKLKTFLLVPFVKDPRSHLGKAVYAITEDIVCKSESRSEVVEAIVQSAFWQSVGTFLNQAVVRIAGTRDDRTLGWGLPRDICGRIDGDGVRRIVGR